MNDDSQIKIIESLKKTVEQMKTDDLEEYSDSACESFSCNCCGQEKVLAGSLTYNDYLLCNDCVLLAEISLALGKIKAIDELINAMEDKRFDTMYESIFNENNMINNLNN